MQSFKQRYYYEFLKGAIFCSDCIRWEHDFNHLVAGVAFSILLWLTPDDFTRQWEISWPPEG